MADDHYPRILAERPDGALLVALDARDGCIYQPTQRNVSPRLSLATLFGQPYWRAYHGHGQELRDWPGPPPAPTSTFPNTSPHHHQQKETSDNG